MKHSILLILALSISGCVQLPDDGRGHRDDDPHTSSIAEAAAKSTDAYRQRLADEWQKTADTATNFKDWQPAYEDLQKRLKAAREEAFRPFTDACDRETGTGDVKYDPAILSRVAREAAEGFRGNSSHDKGK